MCMNSIVMFSLSSITPLNEEFVVSTGDFKSAQCHQVVSGNISTLRSTQL